jgi:hypothetical protein
MPPMADRERDRGWSEKAGVSLLPASPQDLIEAFYYAADLHPDSIVKSESTSLGLGPD